MNIAMAIYLAAAGIANGAVLVMAAASYFHRRNLTDSQLFPELRSAARAAFHPRPGLHHRRDDRRFSPPQPEGEAHAED